MSLLRDEGPQYQGKMVPSVSKQKGIDEAKKARRKNQDRRNRLKWFRKTTSKAETALRLAATFLPLVLLVGVFGRAASLPNDWKVEQKITIEGTSAEVFGLIEDLSTWPRWSTIADLNDGTAQFPVARRGDSAVLEMHDDGDTTVRLLIDQWQPFSRIGYHLWQGSGSIPREGTVEVTTEDGKTVVVWREAGSVSDDALGVLERYALEGRAADVRQRVIESLEALKMHVKKTRDAPGKKKVEHKSAKERASAGTTDSAL